MSLCWWDVSLLMASHRLQIDWSLVERGQDSGKSPRKVTSFPSHFCHTKTSQAELEMLPHNPIFSLLIALSLQLKVKVRHRYVIVYLRKVSDRLHLFQVAVCSNPSFPCQTQICQTYHFVRWALCLSKTDVNGSSRLFPIHEYLTSSFLTSVILLRAASHLFHLQIWAQVHIE